MKIHSDYLTRNDLAMALSTKALDGVYFDYCSAAGSRKRARGFDFRLQADAGKDGIGKTRRRRNTGRYGAEDAFQEAYTFAATYWEHGVFFANLFAVDPSAIIGPYTGAIDFHEKTKSEFMPALIGAK